MGDKKLNGVETALELRKHGHSGPIVLRTSDKKEDLHQEHKNFNNLLETKAIECCLDKSDHIFMFLIVEN